MYIIISSVCFRFLDRVDPGQLTSEVSLGLDRISDKLQIANVVFFEVWKHVLVLSFAYGQLDEPMSVEPCR